MNSALDITRTADSRPNRSNKGDRPSRIIDLHVEDDSYLPPISREARRWKIEAAEAGGQMMPNARSGHLDRKTGLGLSSRKIKEW
jgi:hypothetical protein